MSDPLYFPLVVDIAVTFFFNQKRRLSGKWYTDTFHGHHKTIEGNTCSQIFANKQLFAISYPLSSKRFAREALKLFITQFGVPEYLTFDGAAEQCGKNTGNKARY